MLWTRNLRPLRSRSRQLSPPPLLSWPLRVKLRPGFDGDSEGATLFILIYLLGYVRARSPEHPNMTAQASGALAGRFEDSSLLARVVVELSESSNMDDLNSEPNPDPRRQECDA